MRKCKFILIWAIFILPLATSFLVYHYHDHFHFRTVNHGQFITPVLKVDYFAGNEKKWKIVYVSDESDNYQKINYELRQLQKALGKDGKRVTLLLINNTNEHTQQLAKDLFQSGKNNFVVANKIYLIDPANFLFMYYSSNVNKLDILKDMKKVLEVSQIG